MITALLGHAALELRTGVRDRSLLLMTYLFPLGFYLFMGLFMTRMNPAFTAIMVPGMTVLAMLSAGMFSLPGPLVAAREGGVLRSYRISAVPVGAIVGVPVVTTTAHLMVVAAVVAVTAPLVFGAERVAPGGFLLVTVVAGLCHAALGMLIGVISADTRITVLWSQLIFLPSMMLAGIVVPLDQLPEMFRPLSRVLPATHAMEAYHGLAGSGPGGPGAWLSLGALAVGGALAVALALACYSWDEHGAGRRLPRVLAVAALLPFVAVGLLTG